MRKSFLIGVFSVFAIVGHAQSVRLVKITDLQKIIAESKTPLVVNFWATWCKPCIEELPYFHEEVKKHKVDSVQLILVSLDFKEAFPDDIIKTAHKRKFTGRLLWLDETNADYFCPLIDEQWQGECPATLFINNKTGYRKFLAEKISKDKFQKEIMAILR